MCHTQFGKSALHYGVYATPELVPAFLAAGFSANAKDIVRCLCYVRCIGPNTKTNYTTQNWDTPLHTAAEHNPPDEVFAALVAAGANLSARALVGLLLFLK